MEKAESAPILSYQACISSLTREQVGLRRDMTGAFLDYLLLDYYAMLCRVCVSGHFFHR